MRCRRASFKKYPFDDYKIKLPKKQVEFLTIEEINKIETTHFEIERLEIIKDLFIFSCYSGLAFMEVSNLTEDNLFIGNDGEVWLNLLHSFGVSTGKPAAPRMAILMMAILFLPGDLGLLEDDQP